MGLVKEYSVVKDTLKNYKGVSKVPITISLLNDVKNSHKAYQQYIEKQKEKEASERGTPKGKWT